MNDEEELITPTIGQGDVKQAERDRTFKGRLDAFNEQTEALKILGSKNRWTTDWNRTLQTNIFNRGPLSPHSPLLDDFSNTMQTATGLDPTDPKQMSAEMLSFYSDARIMGPTLAVTKRAAARVKPEVYESIIDMALSPLKKAHQTWDDFLYMVGGGVGTGTGVGPDDIRPKSRSKGRPITEQDFDVEAAKKVNVSRIEMTSSDKAVKPKKSSVVPSKGKINPLDVGIDANVDKFSVILEYPDLSPADAGKWKNKVIDFLNQANAHRNKQIEYGNVARPLDGFEFIDTVKKGNRTVKVNTKSRSLIGPDGRVLSLIHI